MRGFAAAWPDLEISPQAVGRLPWGHVRALLDRLDTREDRDWYAAEAVGQGWSRAVLEYQIGTGLHRRVGAAPSNFADQLPAVDSDLAQQLVRDPYVFDHLSLSRPVAERDLEQALMDRLQATVLEFGHGMAFVGRQVRFDLDGDEQVVDLLLFHVEQLRYIVVELKVLKLTGGDVGQLGTYVAMVDDRLRRPALHAPTLGLLLVAGRSEQLVRYALSASSAPVAVADWSSLPADARAVLPPANRLAAALDTSTLPAPTPRTQTDHPARPSRRPIRAGKGDLGAGMSRWLECSAGRGPDRSEPGTVKLRMSAVAIHWVIAVVLLVVLIVCIDNHLMGLAVVDSVILAAHLSLTVLVTRRLVAQRHAARNR